jgi:hypothetical protein
VLITYRPAFGGRIIHLMIAMAGRIHKSPLSRKKTKCVSGPDSASCATATVVDPDAPRRKSLMDWDDIRRIAAHRLVTIGAHTVHHYNLKRLDEGTARANWPRPC